MVCNVSIAGIFCINYILLWNKFWVFVCFCLCSIMDIKCIIFDISFDQWNLGLLNNMLLFMLVYNSTEITIIGIMLEIIHSWNLYMWNLQLNFFWYNAWSHIQSTIISITVISNHTMHILHIYWSNHIIIDASHIVKDHF